MNYLVIRSDIGEGDLIIMHNTSKAKKTPGTKNQNKYLGPLKTTFVSNSHIQALEVKTGKVKKVPIHLARRFYQRSDKDSQPPITTCVSSPCDDNDIVESSRKRNIDDNEIPVVKCQRLEVSNITKLRFPNQNTCHQDFIQLFLAIRRK